MSLFLLRQFFVDRSPAGWAATRPDDSVSTHARRRLPTLADHELLQLRDGCYALALSAEQELMNRPDPTTEDDATHAF